VDMSKMKSTDPSIPKNMYLSICKSNLVLYSTGRKITPTTKKHRQTRKMTS
jgi:hypothetical protein